MKPLRLAAAAAAPLRGPPPAVRLRFQSLLPARQLTTPAARAQSTSTPTLTPTPLALPRRLLRASHAHVRPGASPVSPLFRLLRGPGARRSHTNSSKPPKLDPTPNLGSPEATPSFSQRMRKLSREYGWVALGVYLGLSVLDFPFCFLAVRMLGTDRIGRWEHAAITAFWNLVHVALPDVHRAKKPEGAVETEAGHVLDGAVSDMADVAAAEEANAGEEATIWTQLALAYAIHKSFIFFRVPLTAAVTPKVVKVLRGWGWNIGKRKPKA
ncbi:peptide alpha-n-acetyltransferase nat2 [Diplodia corticola]|uniref:Peptide alpha-n-acetyltransferase nat2 n=1 Tax=Diplodia corticola TaxID=236234 RepID=A0A1J9R431_9PEZI|nr:peptide alpha-n-acetyltransferase nat2 [Diplodia corticola]OJD34970.1 peptide alpha-n-acetyltransferase nat2 [Diplodia corticola]